MNLDLDRRQLFTAAAVGLAGAVLPPGLARAASISAAPGATLDDIEHIVVLMQENRSFDEYFGRMSGVIGFDDPHALAGVFKQVDTDVVNNPSGYVLPWRMDTTKTKAQSYGGLDHSYHPQHVMWNEGLMDQFLLGQTNDPIVMGYYDREDIPYHYALADAFTVLDRYHCSVFGPTNPNRIMLMSGTIDPTGTLGGGPCIENTQTAGSLKWESFAETLQKAGVDWYLYQEKDNYDDNMLPFFAGFTDTTTDLYRRGNSVIPSTTLLGEATAAKLKADVLAGKLPQVSYIVGAQETSEHPDATTGRGAQFIDQCLEALTADPAVWAKTLLILNYDENDGHFDHVVPPTPPATELDEYASALPVGLGFRVPCILISPFTKGGLVCSDVFDHTSVIKLIERRFKVTCPNISSWRRSTVGDLTTAINFAATPSTTIPALPDADTLAAQAKAQSALPDPALPATQVMPTQEKLPLRGRPSGIVAGTVAAPVVAPVVKPVTKAVKTPARHLAVTPARSLAATGLDPALPVAAAAAAVLGLVAVRTRKEADQ